MSAHVALRPITRENLRACLALRVAEDQAPYVAPNVQSLAEAYANEKLTPLAIYRGDVWCREPGPEDPMVGFVMYQVWDEVGFIMRLMVDAEHQRQGYGRAAMVEVVRRLKLTPQVMRIATSYVPANVAAEQLYTGLGFTRPLPGGDGRETYVALEWDPAP